MGSMRLLLAALFVCCAALSAVVVAVATSGSSFSLLCALILLLPLVPCCHTQARIMRQDWSWNRPAIDYVELYYSSQKV